MHVGFIIYYMFIQRALKPVAELSTTVVDIPSTTVVDISSTTIVDISSTTVVDISSCTLVDNWCVLRLHARGFSSEGEFSRSTSTGRCGTEEVEAL